ncbi:MAG: hypothetical protein JSS91_13930 [Bacteroidetes bacterium]|nr:hypothetical protein [Bacteroidota bacterium]
MIKILKKFTDYYKRRKVLKYRLYKFLQKHSRVKDDSPVIIVWELGGFADILKKNAIISAALNLRGYKTHFIICDGTPEACIQRGLEKKENISEWSLRCDGCIRGMKYSAIEYSVEYSFAGDHISDDKKKEFRELSESIELRELYNYKLLGVEVGMLAWSSVIRYMKGYVIEKKDLKKEDEIILRKYFYAGLVNTFTANEVIEKFKPVSLYSSHGVYVDYSPPVLLAYLKGIKTLCWSSGFKDFLHYFTIPKKPNKLEFRGITDEEWKKRASVPLSEKENRFLDSYIHHRFNKGNKRDFLNVTLPESEDVLRKKLGFEKEKKIACLFCHVSWDLSFDLSKMIFDNANQWLSESMDAILKNDKVNWIIRVHPGEEVSGSLYTNDDFLKERYPVIPPNVKILWSDSEINSLGLYKIIDVGITLFGTMGAELPLLGKPVISGGEAHFTGKGFTIDTKSKEEYFRYLDNIDQIEPVPPEMIDLARKYAYSYFIQRQIPLNIINKKEGHFGNLDINKLDRLLPGNDLIIEAICDSIINGKDVILDEKMVEASGLEL